MDTQRAVAHLQDCVQRLAASIASTKAALSQCSPDQPLERALLHLALARAAVALTEIQLCAQGAPDPAASLQEEQARLKLYEVKVQGAAEAAWLAQHRPSTQVNVNAANRFISHALPDLSQEQRAALKQATARATAEAAQLDLAVSPHKKRKGGLREPGSAADALLGSLAAPSQPQKQRRPG